MERARPLFPWSHGKPRVDDRRVLSRIIFINRNGLRWRDAPAECGPPKTLYNRWKRLLSGMQSMPCRATGVTRACLLEC